MALISLNTVHAGSRCITRGGVDLSSTYRGAGVVDLTRYQESHHVPALDHVAAPRPLLMGAIIQAKPERPSFFEALSSKIGGIADSLVKSVDQWLTDRNLPALAVRLGATTAAATGIAVFGLTGGLAALPASLGIASAVGAVTGGLAFYVGLREMAIRQEYVQKRQEAGLTHSYGAKF